MRSPLSACRTILSATALAGTIALAGFAFTQAGPPGGPPPPLPRGDHGDPNHGPPVPDPVDETELAQGTVVLHGGYETDPRDHGRPVVLVAGALGVPIDIFRRAFSGVHPVSPDSGGPTDVEARDNKAALMKVLEPYGVTDQRLNAVSDQYRYVKSRGEIWKNTLVKITAVINNGRVTGFKIDNAGAGYSSAPTITVAGYTGATATTTLHFDTDMTKNGSIATTMLDTPAK